MWSAVEGRSTLGIPESVGKKFVGSAHDMAPRDWRGLIFGLVKFLFEESDEPEHAADAVPTPDQIEKLRRRLRETEAARADAERRAKSGDKEDREAFAAAAQRHAEEYRRLSDALKSAEALRKSSGAKDAVSPNHAAGVLFVAPDGHVLLMKRGAEEKNYPGHWSLPGGKGHPDEPPVATAAREAAEETGGVAPAGEKHLLSEKTTPTGMTFRTFGQRVSDKFDPKLNAEHSEARWFAPGDLPEPIHPAVAETLGGYREALGADAAARKGEWQRVTDGIKLNMPTFTGSLKTGTMDALPFALDEASVREYDSEGRLIVRRTPISKANVCEYLGEEIPDAESLGLDPRKRYRLYRHPDELAKAAPSFNLKPMLSEHVAVTAATHRKDVTIGATGTDAEFDAPYLYNSLAIWPAADISDIEDERKREISSAYRYTADMTPGKTPDGEPYDGVMRAIECNHVIICKKGRAGPDVVVGDSALPTATTEIVTMAKTRLGAYLAGALSHYMKSTEAPVILGLDAAIGNVTGKTFVAERPKIKAAVVALKSIAKDADVDGAAKFLDGLKDKPTDDEDPDPANPGEKKLEGPEKKEFEDHLGGDEEKEANEFLKSKMSGADWASYDAMRRRANDARKARDAAPPNFTGMPKVGGEDMVTKKGMDEAIATAVTAAVEKTKSETLKLASDQFRAVDEARKAVRGRVGDIHIACDSAEAVYRHAFAILKVDVANVPPAGFPALFAALPAPGRQEPRIAADAASAASFAERHPHAARIRVA
jgi:8-oxo-dGTP pyrophosphatase MutT (NUDIX family)